MSTGLLAALLTRLFLRLLFLDHAQRRSNLRVHVVRHGGRFFAGRRRFASHARVLSDPLLDSCCGGLHLRCEVLRRRFYLGREDGLASLRFVEAALMLALTFEAFFVDASARPAALPKDR